VIDREHLSILSGRRGRSGPGRTIAI